MKIVSIYYEKVFPIAAYQNEKIGIEIQVDPEDDFDSAYKFAKAKVEEWAKQKVESAMSCSGYEIPIDKPHTDDMPVINWRGDTGMEQFENAIRDAETVEELGIIRRRTDFPATLMPLFMKKMKNLTPKTVAPY